MAETAPAGRLRCLGCAAAAVVDAVACIEAGSWAISVACEPCLDGLLLEMLLEVVLLLEVLDDVLLLACLVESARP